MRHLTTARDTYAQPWAPMRSPRSVEYDLLARITQRLRTAWEVRKQDFPGLVAAIADNNRVWAVLAADVADPDNALPQPLRARLFYLYQFIEQHSRKVLADGAGVEVLVDINTAVMRGLRGDPGTAR